MKFFSFIILAITLAGCAQEKITEHVLKPEVDEVSQWQTLAANSKMQTLIVATNGNDKTGNGSLERPFRTLTKAAQLAKPATVIELRGGLYPQAHEIVQARGQAHLPIIIRPYNHEKVILSGKNYLKPVLIEAEDKSKIISVLDLRYAQYVVVDGLEVQDSNGYGISTWEAEHVLVQNCLVHDIWSRGMGGSGEDMVFANNKITRTVLMNKNEKVFDDRAKKIISYWAAAADTWFREDGSPSKNIVWKNNEVSESWGEGIDAVHADGVRIEGNEVFNNYSVLIYVDHARNVVINNNHLYNTTLKYIRRDTKDNPEGILIASEHYNKPKPMMVENVSIINNRIENASDGIAFWRDPDNKSSFNKYRNVVIIGNIIKDPDIMAINFKFINETEPQLSHNLFQNNIVYAARFIVDGQTEPLMLRFENPNLWSVKNNQFIGKATMNATPQQFREFKD